MAIRCADGLSIVATFVAVACCTSVGVPAEGATVALSCRAKEDSCEAVQPEARGEANALAQRLSTVSAMETVRQDGLKVDEHEATRTGGHGNDNMDSRKGSPGASFTQRHQRKESSAKKKIKVASTKVSVNSSLTHQRGKNKLSARKKLGAAGSSRQRTTKMRRTEVSGNSALTHERGKNELSARKKLGAAGSSRQITTKMRRTEVPDNEVFAKTLKAYAQQQREKHAVHAGGWEAPDTHAKVQRKEQALESHQEMQLNEKRNRIGEVGKKEKGKEEGKGEGKREGKVKGNGKEHNEKALETHQEMQLNEKRNRIKKEGQKEKGIAKGKGKGKKKEHNKRAVLAHAQEIGNMTNATHGAPLMQAVVTHDQEVGNTTSGTDRVPLMQALVAKMQEVGNKTNVTDGAPKDDPMGMGKASMKITTLPKDDQHHNHKTYSEDWQKEYPKVASKSPGSADKSPVSDTIKKTEEATKQKEAKAVAPGLAIQAVLAVFLTTTLQFGC